MSDMQREIEEATEGIGEIKSELETIGNPSLAYVTTALEGLCDYLIVLAQALQQHRHY